MSKVKKWCFTWVFVGQFSLIYQVFDKKKNNTFLNNTFCFLMIKIMNFRHYNKMISWKQNKTLQHVSFLCTLPPFLVSLKTAWIQHLLSDFDWCDGNYLLFSPLHVEIWGSYSKVLASCNTHLHLPMSDSISQLAIPLFKFLNCFFITLKIFICSFPFLISFPPPH